MSNIHWLAVLSAPYFIGSASGSASGLWLALALPAAFPSAAITGDGPDSQRCCDACPVDFPAPLVALRGPASTRTSVRSVPAAALAAPRFLLLHSVQEMQVASP